MSGARYFPMQPHVVAEWQRVRRHSLIGKSLWREDAIGSYPFRQGDCLRDAFPQHLGARHPALAELTRTMALADVAAFCERQGIRFLHGVWEVVILAGAPVMWFLAAQGSEVAGRAVFSHEPLHIIQSGREILAVALLERGMLEIRQ